MSVAVADAVDQAAANAGESNVTVECRNEPSGLDVTLRFAGETLAVHHPLPARNV